MPDSGAPGSPIDRAVAQVLRWLDHGPAAAWVQRDPRIRVGVAGTWTLDLRHDGLPMTAARLVVPTNFPAASCELYVDPSYFLTIPHIEADGHVCLGRTPLPSDYDDPIGAIKRALQTFKDELAIPARDPVWVAQQFDAERDSYWAQLCLSRASDPLKRPTAPQTYVDIAELGRWSRGALAGYVRAGQRERRFTLQIASLGDANGMAARHGWNVGTMVRGDALFVRLPATARWTPHEWPRSFAALEALIADATAHELSLRTWLNETGWRDTPDQAPTRLKKRRADRRDVPPGQRPLLIVLVHEASVFGYQLYAPLLPGQTAPAIEPLHLTRIDPDWALARDHQLDTLRARRARRVLLLGCGSLGSPLAQTLARAGVGRLDLVDSQVMEAENTARHALGIAEVGREKATALATRLQKDIPGIAVCGFMGKVQTWCAKHCRPGDYDLVIECTGESSVRTYLSHMRADLFGACPLVHAWTEPLCSAGHVVLTQPAEPWPADDPADSLVNATDLSADATQVHVPACAGGFHPYGAADIELVAAFAAERLLTVLDDLQHASTVWSWVRSAGFFAQLSSSVTLRAIVPASSSKWDSATVTRDLTTVLCDL